MIGAIGSVASSPAPISAKDFDEDHQEDHALEPLRRDGKHRPGAPADQHEPVHTADNRRESKDAREA